MVAYNLDLTGLSQANRVLNEIRDVSKEGHRIFVPTAGAFYTRGFEIRNSSNGQLLQPGTQYILLNMERTATIQSGLNVCTVVYIRDMSVTSVTMTYQCVGGIYQNTQSSIEERLKDYLDGTTPADVVGSLVGLPVQFPPTTHLHLGVKTVYGFNDVVMMLDLIRKAITTGDDGMIALIFQHIDMTVADAEKRITARLDESVERVNQLDTQTEIGIGRFIFTDNPANPNTYLGYGEWVLNPNVFLYGANLGENPGDLIYIDAGNGNIGRMTYIWQRVESTGAISYNIVSSSSTVNEGDTITFTLNTTGITPGTVIPYTISGVSASDVAGGLLTGKFNIGAGGIATTQVRLLEDNTTEGNETLRIRLTNMPSVETAVNIQDTSKSPAISLRFSANSNGTGTITTANEGATIYLVVNAVNVPAGSLYNIHYTNSTMQSDDFDGVRPDTVRISEGTTIVPFNIKADYATETTEVLSVALSKGTYQENVAVTTVNVVDSSKNTNWSVRFSSNTTGTDTITSADEGSTVYAIIEGKFVPSSFNGQLVYSGVDTSANGDLVNPATPTFAVVAGDNVTYRATIALRGDVLTEGTETLTATFINTGTNATLAVGTLIINDTSTSPTYQLKFTSNTSGTDTITSINEGAVGYAYLRTSNIPNGTNLTVQWGGTADESDFTSTRVTTVTVQNNIATAALSVKADTLTEGQETVTVAFLLNGEPVASGSIILNDTSVTPEYKIRYSSNSSGTGTITSTNEGATIYIVVETKNVANNTKLYLKYTSVTGNVDNNDFVITRPADVTVINNSAIVPVTLRNDLTSEGSESMRTSIMLGSINGTEVDSTDLQINDSSVPSFNVYFSTNASGTGSVTSANEGTTVYCVVETQGVVDGTTLSLSYSLTSEDFEGAVPSTVNITENRGIVAFTLKNDFLTEGNETLVVTALRSGIQIATGTLLINDSSRNQEFNARWSATATGAGTITEANEGATVYYVVDTLNVPNNTVLPFRIMEDNVLVPSNQFDTLPASVTIQNNTAKVAVKLKADAVFETNKTYQGVLTHGSGALVGNADLQIIDSSIPATTVSFMKADMSGAVTELNEGTSYVVAVDMRAAPVGTAYQLSFSGNVTADDFVVDGSNLVPGAVYSRSSASTIQYYPIAVKGDLITEGDETVKVSILVNSIERASRQVPVRDTSKNTSVTVRFTGSESSNTAIASINEGQTVYLVVTATDVSDGTAFDLTWSGSITSTQWIATLPTNITVTGNRGVIALTARNDQTIDGTQTATVTVVNHDTAVSLGQAQIQVNDTSTPSVTLSLSQTTINEGYGTSVTATVSGTRTIDGWMEFRVLNMDGTVADADFTGWTFPIRKEPTSEYQTTFAIGLTTAADKLTEGQETFRIEALYMGLETSKATATLIVNDTSVAEGYSAYFAASSGATAANKITSVNEGAVFYYIVETTNVANGTVLTLQYPTGVGLVDATDFDGTRATTMTVNSNRAWVALSTKADGLVEGSEKFTVRALNAASTQLLSTDITVVDTSKPVVTGYLRRGLNESTKAMTFEVPSDFSSVSDLNFVVEYNDVATGLNLHVKWWFDFKPDEIDYTLQGEANASYRQLTGFAEGVSNYTASIPLPEMYGGVDRPTNNLHVRVYLDDWRTEANPRLLGSGSYDLPFTYANEFGWDHGYKVVVYKLSSVPNPTADQPWNEPEAYTINSWASQTTIEEGVPYGIWIISRAPWYNSTTNYLRYTYDGVTYTAAALLAQGQVEAAPPASVAVSPQNGSSNHKWKKAGNFTFRTDKTTEGDKTFKVEVGPTAAFPRSVSQSLLVLDTSIPGGVTGLDGIALAFPMYGASSDTPDISKARRQPDQVYLNEVIAKVDAVFAEEEHYRGNDLDGEYPGQTNAVLWTDPYTRGPRTLNEVSNDTPFSRLKPKLATATYEDAVWVTYRDRYDWTVNDQGSLLTVNPLTKPTNALVDGSGYYDVFYPYSFQGYRLGLSSLIVVRLKTTGLPDGTKVIPVYSKTDHIVHLTTDRSTAVVPAFNLSNYEVFPGNSSSHKPYSDRNFKMEIVANTTSYTPKHTLAEVDIGMNLYTGDTFDSNLYSVGHYYVVKDNVVTLPFYASQVRDTSIPPADASVTTYKFQVNVDGVKQPTWFDFDLVSYPQLYSAVSAVYHSDVTYKRSFYLPQATITEITIVGGGGGGGGSGYMGTANISSGKDGGTSTLEIEGSGINPFTFAYAGGGKGGADGRTAASNSAKATSTGGVIGNWLGAGVWNGIPSIVTGRQMYSWVEPHPNLYPVTIVYMRYTSRVVFDGVSLSNYIVAYSEVGKGGTIGAGPTAISGTHAASRDSWVTIGTGTAKIRKRTVAEFNLNFSHRGSGGSAGNNDLSATYWGVAGGSGAVMRVAVVNRGESPVKITFTPGTGGKGGHPGGYALDATTADTGYALRKGGDGVGGAMLLTRIWQTGKYYRYMNTATSPIVGAYTK